MFFLILTVLFHLALFPLHFSHMSHEKGLPSSTVYKVFQDRRGCIWMGTLKGLVKYDGYTFRLFKYCPNELNSLQSSIVTSIIEGNREEIWIGTNGGGISSFNTVSEKFTNYTEKKDEKNSLSSNSVNSLFKDRSGRIWISTAGGGISVFNADTESFIRIRKNRDKPEDGIYSNWIRSVLQDVDHPEIFWIATEGQGLVKFNFNKRASVRYKIHDKDSDYGYGSVWVLFDSPVQPDFLWVGTEGRGLKKFNKKTGKFTETFFFDPEDDKHISTVRFIEQSPIDRKRILIGTTRGLNDLDVMSGDYSQYWHSPANKYSLSSDLLTDTLIDSSGLWWIATEDNGINLFRQGMPRFDNFNLRDLGPEIDEKIRITALLEDKNSNFWIGTDSNGIYRVDKLNGNMVNYSDSAGHENALAGHNVNVIYEDLENYVWVGTSAGLNLYKNNRFSDVSKVFETTGKKKICSVVSVYESPVERGYILAGTLNSGLFKINKVTLETEKFNFGVSFKKEWINNSINAIVEDKKGKIWLGTSTGLCSYDRQSRVFSYYRVNKSGNSISGNNIKSLFQPEKHQNVLWIGTESNGLNRFLKDEKKFTVYDEAFASSTIASISQDRFGFLWLFTDKGIFKLNPVSGKTIKYDSEDGLENIEFNRPVYRSSEGEIYCPGKKNCTVFNPDNFLENSFRPVVILTDIKPLAHKQGANNNGTLLRDYFTTKKIELNSNTSIIITLSVSDYTVPSKNIFKYKLKKSKNEWDKSKWVRITGENTLILADLAPGSYELRVLGANCDGVWGNEPLDIKLTVNAPFWLRWWFLTGVFVLAAAVIFFIFRIFSAGSVEIRIPGKEDLKEFFIKYNITPREQDIVVQILRGKSNKEIEDLLFISIKTVKNHVYSIYKKTDVSSRVQLNNKVLSEIKIKGFKNFKK